MYKKQKGITLIALVITIIVLIILAAVALGVLTGDNGIINKANKSKTDTKIGTAEEIIKLAYSEAILEQKIGESMNPIDNVIAKLAEKGYTLELVNSNGEQVTQEVTGIQVKEGTNAVTSVSMDAGASDKTLTVSLIKQTPGENTEYRVEIEGRYYRVYLENGNVRIDENDVRDTLQPSGVITQSYTVTITVGSTITSYVTSSSTVTLTVGETESATITITPPAEVTENKTGNIELATTGKTGEAWNKTIPVTIRKTISLGDYVWYYSKDGTEANKILCRVLYNDETYGLQIISNRPEKKLTQYHSSYNEFITNLNNATNEFLEEDKIIATDVRSVGTVSIVENGIFTNKNDAVSFDTNSNGEKVMRVLEKDSYGFYTTDQNYNDFDKPKLTAINATEVSDTSIASNYWIASRYYKNTPISSTNENRRYIYGYAGCSDGGYYYNNNNKYVTFVVHIGNGPPWYAMNSYTITKRNKTSIFN